MLGKKVNHTFILSSVILLLTANHLGAQSAWRLYLPPDKSFSLELPGKAKLQRGVTDKEVKRFFEGGLFDTAKFVGAYSVKGISRDAKPNLWISVYRPSKPIDDRAFDEEVHLNALIIGGDKEDSDFAKQANVLAGRFHGREYLFERNKTYYRLRFINAGNRIYFLMYCSKNEEVSSEVADKIFASFKPR